MCPDAGLSIVRVLPAGNANQARWPLYDAASSRALEQDVAQHLPPHTLMQRAGLAVCRLARALAPHAARFHVVAGPGNNGGDGFEAAVGLRRAGCEVLVHCLADLGRLPPDAAASLARAREASVPLSTEDLRTPPGPQDLVIDALLGQGVSRPAAGRLARTIAVINGSSALRLAVDLPSGLPSDTGHWEAAATAPDAGCIRAHHTLSLLTLKPGLFTAQGRDHAGEIWFCNLGVDSHARPTPTWLAGPPDTVLPARLHAQHKGSFGNVVVIGGAPGMSGAALLAARSALHRGAGRVFVQLLDATGMAVDPTAPELMFRREIDWQAPGSADWTAVCGCGGGEAVRAVLATVLSRANRLVLDADALNAVATDPAQQALLKQRSARGRATVLTPHPLEAARLLGCTVTDVQADRLTHARELARRFSAVVVLKGSGSIVAEAEGSATINPTGNALLATAGTGDVLAGWIGALWAQGATPVQAATAAVFQHGAAADAWAAPHQALQRRVASHL